MYMSLDSLQLFGLYNAHGIVMDLRNVFRRMIQVGFIDGIGLRAMVKAMFGVVVKLMSNGNKLFAFLSDMKQWWSRPWHRRRPYCRRHRRSRSSAKRKRNDAKGKS
ncbi:hypothetical protein [Absidia glauca]|uniref:Uncharacterized protein n=1 Tax=Absidia glauca TaxID=4829 RepID=A0A168REZ1_ABSGL|nr:hypothetical protein [Absidia glauca]